MDSKLYNIIYSVCVQLRDGFSSLVWSTIPALASKLRLLPESDFVHLVNAAFRLRLADLQYFQSQILEGGDINLQDEIT